MVSKKRFDQFFRHFRPFLTVFWVNFFPPPPIHLGPQVFLQWRRENFLPTGGRTGQPKVVKEVLADLKVFDCVRGEFKQHKAPFPPFHVYINGNVDVYVDVEVNVDVTDEVDVNVDVTSNVDVDIDSMEV